MLLVMSAIMVLTMVAVEFAYNANIHFRLAVKQKERLQAYYLARSGFEFLRLQMKVGAEVQEQIAGLLSRANIDLPFDINQPLCRIFPLNTGLFRAFMDIQKSGGEGALPEEMLQGLQLSGVEEFMQFTGDFETECVDESGKLDLNFFLAADAREQSLGGENAYDSHKKLLVQTLTQESYKNLFERLDESPEEIIRNIADWVDTNNAVNHYGGSEGGGEEGAYAGLDTDFAAKNGKFTTPGEVYRVAGVYDSWWNPLSENFTIYGTKSREGVAQVNVCRARNEVIQGLVLRYLETRPELAGRIDRESAEVLSALTESVKAGCVGAKPDPNKIASDLDAAIDNLAQGTGGEAKPPEPTPPESPEGEEGGEGGGGVGTTVGSRFARWITTESHVFKLKMTGTVGNPNRTSERETSVQIESVIDFSGGKDPSKWKTLYWKIY